MAPRMQVLCVIPARSGSKGIPGKNLRTVAGASLVARAVFQARAFARRVKDAEVAVMVDTDGPDIAKEAREWGARVPFLRDAALATDTSTSAATVIGLLDRLEESGEVYDAIVLLQPTSPLRSPDEIFDCWKEYAKGKGKITVVTGVKKSAAAAYRAGASSLAEPLIPDAAGARRQDSSELYDLSGSVYVISAETLRAASRFVIPGETLIFETAERGALDVDAPRHLDDAELLARADESATVLIEGKAIGAGNPCFFIAEAGVNHNGDEKLALSLIDEAARSGVDAVKFQTFDPALLVSDTAPQAEYQTKNTGAARSQREMLNALTLPRESYARLQSRAKELGVMFMSTPFDERSADFLEELGCPAFKLGSGEVTNHSFLAHVAGKGRPILLSTGMSTLAEVARAVEVVAEHGNPPLVLLHCVSNYPASPADCNLRAMGSMRSLFRVPVGWSDHTLGSAVSLAAVAMGASVIEKHFTLRRDLPGPDHVSSLEPREIAALVREIRDVEAARGSGIKVPSPGETEVAKVVRRSLHAARDIDAGVSLRDEDIIALRPSGGLPPSALNDLVGRKSRRRIEKGEMLSAEDFD